MIAFARTAVSVAVLAVAMHAVPAASPAARRGAIGPTPCAVEPRTAEEVAALVAAATPAPGHADATPVAAPAADNSPAGAPADAETVAAITAVAREFGGCLVAEDWPRWLALMTDDAVRSVVDPADPGFFFRNAGERVPAGFEGYLIRRVVVRDATVLPDGRVAATVRFGDAGAFPLVFARVGEHWLVDRAFPLPGYGEVVVPAAPARPPSDDEILDRAREGFGEVDSAAYAEPTLIGAEFGVSATLMVGFLGDDDYEGVGCEMFVFERGAHSVTVSALCRADEALAGRAAYLDVEVLRRRRSSDTPPIRCRDVAELSAYIAFACTVDVPDTAP